MKRVRGIAVASRPSINMCNYELGSGTVWGKRERRELGEAGDVRNAKTVELEEARFVKVTDTSMYEVAGKRGYNSEKGRGMRSRKKPGETGSTNKIYVKARRASKGVRGG